MPVIEVDDLFKSYGSLNAVRGISFSRASGASRTKRGPRALSR